MKKFLLWEYNILHGKKFIASSWRTKQFFTIILPFLSLSGMISHNPHILLCLNCLNPCIRHLDVFWNVWNLILWRESGKKLSSCSDYYKNWSFIIGQSEQQFKIQFHFGIFDPVIGEEQLYDAAASQALKCIFFFLSLGPASGVPKLTNYGVV